MRKLILPSSLLAIGLLCPIVTQAQLVMTVNSATKTLSFGTSSDTGSPTGPTGALAYWEVDFGSFTANNVSLDISSALQTDGATASNAELTFDSSSTPYVAVSVFEGTSYTSVAGNGTSIDYSGLNAGLITALESLAGSNTALPLQSGSSFSAIQTTLVPEPATYALLAGGGALGLCALQRRRPKT